MSSPEIPAAVTAAFDQAEATVQQLAEWAHSDACHGTDHGPDVQALLQALSLDSMADALMLATWVIASSTPCDGAQ